MLHADDARTMLHMLPMQCCMGTRHTCTDNTRGQQEGYDLSPVRDLPEGLYQVATVLQLQHQLQQPPGPDHL